MIVDQSVYDMGWYSTGKLHAIAAVVHAVQAVVVLGLTSWLNTVANTTNHGVFKVSRQVALWSAESSSAAGTHAMVGNYSVVETTLDSGYFDVRYAILAFFVLAAVDHACVCLAPMVWEIEQLSSQLRYVEYSISASVMAICIGVETGISDLYTLITIFVLMFVTQILGLLADLTSNPEFSGWNPMQNLLGIYIWTIPHFAGWITCISAYVPILDAFVSSEKNSSIQAPDFVVAIVFTQFLLFISFGFVQAYYLFSKSRLLSASVGVGHPYMNLQQQQYGVEQDIKGLAVTAERAFILLSLVVKTLLAWLILVPILSSAM